MRFSGGCRFGGRAIRQDGMRNIFTVGAVILSCNHSVTKNTTLYSIFPSMSKTERDKCLFVYKHISMIG